MNPVDETLDYYERNAEPYSARTRRRVDRDALQEFCRHLPPAARVLDAGCGSGRDLREFLERGFLAEGFDGSARMAALATAHSGVPVRTRNLLLMSEPKEAYDGVWCHRTLLHLPPNGVQRVMNGFFACLKPRGVLFVSMEEGSGVHEDRTDDPSGPARHFHRYPADEVASLLRQSGFQALSQGRTQGTPPTVAWIARRIG